MTEPQDKDKMESTERHDDIIFSRKNIFYQSTPADQFRSGLKRVIAGIHKSFSNTSLKECRKEKQEHSRREFRASTGASENHRSSVTPHIQERKIKSMKHKEDECQFDRSARRCKSTPTGYVMPSIKESFGPKSVNTYYKAEEEPPSQKDASANAGVSDSQEEPPLQKNASAKTGASDNPCGEQLLEITPHHGGQLLDITSEAVVSDEDWLNSLETSDDHQVLSDPNPELIKEIKKLGKQYGLQYMRWSHCLEKIDTIIVSAKVTKKKQSTSESTLIELNAKAQKLQKLKQSNFKVEFIIVGQCVTLSGKVYENECNPELEGQNEVKWKHSGNIATCELIMKGSLPLKEQDRPRLFAVTSAHLLLRREEMDPFEEVSTKKEKTDESLMKETREKVHKRIDKYAYELKLGGNEMFLPLANRPMVAYRVYQNKKSGRLFQNDIAVLPIEAERVLLNSKCLITDYRSLTIEVLSGMASRGVRVFAKGRQGKVVCPRTINEKGPSMGYSLSFQLEKGEVEVKEFTEGDSGSVIFTRSIGEGGTPARKYAVGLLRGMYPMPYRSMYEAVVLGAALKEIHESYPQLIAKEMYLYRPT